ncbi:hypothetical protein [Kitasatospora sp. NPDC088346]|uniref:hypothetical protein n=1 Tax=Kitasatospora sp. NPDC088346 TaxID=3364073 RepID=UPI0037F90F87
MFDTPVAHPYNLNPCYPPMVGAVGSGWCAAAATLPTGSRVLAIDGPAALDWEAVVDGLATALDDGELKVLRLDTRQFFVPWGELLARAEQGFLAEDPDFATRATGDLADFFADLPWVQPPTAGAMLVVYGPGAALVDHDVLWYADLPKRHAEAAITAGTGRNLGQPHHAGPGTTRRLFYIDWPLLDRHRDAIAPRVALWLDTQEDVVTWLDGEALRRTLADLSGRPIRTRPTFNSTSWGGHWAQRELGFNPEARNTAIGYELIAPESGVLIGERGHPKIEVPFQLLVALHPVRVLGERVHAEFGTSFPIRFDFLDTVDGGNLSLHCHPREEYMREVFGWPYPQHETYYVMVGGPGCKVYLGLHDADVSDFRDQALAADNHRQPFDVEQHVQTFPADAHQLFLIPAGTPHASGKGNVVLEVSATPYLYSLRFYDWLRRDDNGNDRPVHIDHAFNNLDRDRVGIQVRNDLVQQPRTLRTGDGWREEMIGDLPEMFYEVRRFVLDSDRAATDDTAGRFHMLNVVDGDGVVLETSGGHRCTLAFAETLTVPAEVGAYTLRRAGTGRTQVVKAVVR